MALTRRDFLKGAATAGAAVYVGVDLASGPSRTVYTMKPYGMSLTIQHEAYIRDLARLAVQRYDMIAYGVFANRMFPVSEPWMYQPWTCGFTPRLDQRILRKLHRKSGRAARGVRRYQGMRR